MAKNNEQSEKFIQKVRDVFVETFPLVKDGTIEIKDIAQGAGRVLISVTSTKNNVDPISRLIDDIELIETIEQKIGGDEVSLFLWSDDPKQLIESALDPIFINGIALDEESHTATVKVVGGPPKDSPEQLAYKQLAEDLTGWNIVLE